MTVIELKRAWRPTGNLRIDLPIMLALVETKKLQQFITENMPRKVVG